MSKNCFVPPKILRPEKSMFEAVGRNIFPKVVDSETKDVYEMKQIKLSGNQADYPCFFYPQGNKKEKIELQICPETVDKDIWSYKDPVNNKMVFWDKTNYCFIIWQGEYFNSTMLRFQHGHFTISDTAKNMLEQNCRLKMKITITPMEDESNNKSKKNGTLLVGNTIEFKSSDTYQDLFMQFVNTSDYFNLAVLIQCLILDIGYKKATSALLTLIQLRMQLTGQKPNTVEISRLIKIYTRVCVYGCAIFPEHFATSEKELLLALQVTELPTEILKIIAEYIGTSCYRIKWLDEFPTLAKASIGHIPATAGEIKSVFPIW